MDHRSNQKEEVPFSHYLEIYRGLDPHGISKRCALPFDGGAFSLTLMGTEYRIPHPAFELCPCSGSRKTSTPLSAGRSTITRNSAAGNSNTTNSNTANSNTTNSDTANNDTTNSITADSIANGLTGRFVDPKQAACDILILRYLCEGKYSGETGRRLSYNEVPWGPVYYRNFDGRCLKRLAYGFGKDIARFKAIIEGAPGLKAEKLPQGDAGYRLEFLSGLYISLILYAEDDEFPPSAQILFDDNFVSAFTAEDLAVVGEVLIDKLKRMG
jgi:hypothetical protein